MWHPKHGVAYAGERIHSHRRGARNRYVELCLLLQALDLIGMGLRV
jgi:hypothetical protein